MGNQTKKWRPPFAWKKTFLLLAVTLLIGFGWGSRASEEAVVHSQGSIPKVEVNPMREKLHLKVVTYNIHHGTSSTDKLSLNEQIELLRRVDADIIGLQEVEKMSPRSGFQNQAKAIAEALGLNYRFAPALSVGPWEYGNVLLTRYPIIEEQTFELQSEKENRIAQLTTLSVEDRPVTVLVTHLGLNGKERRLHIEELTASLQEVNRPLLVLGDFNCEPNAAELTPWLQTLEPVNREKIITFPSLDRQIDHILHSRDFTVTNTYTRTSTASDHLPLIAELEL